MQARSHDKRSNAGVEVAVVRQDVAKAPFILKGIQPNNGGTAK